MRKPFRHQSSVNSNDSSAPLIKEAGLNNASPSSSGTITERRCSDQSAASSQCSAQSRPLIVTRYKSYITNQASTDQSELSSPPGDANPVEDTLENDCDEDMEEEANDEDNGESERKDAAPQVTINDRRHRRRSTVTSAASRKSLTAAQKRQAYGRKSSTLTETLARQLDFDLGFCSSSSSSNEDEGADKFDELYKRITTRMRNDQRKGSNTNQLEEYFINPRGKIWTKSRCKEIFAGKRMRKMAFWFIVIFLAALTVKDVIELVAEYCENPKQSDINIRFNKTMILPNITFCMRRMQAFSHFDFKHVQDWDDIVRKKLTELNDKRAFLHKPWDYRLAAEGYQVISALSSIERETTSAGTIRSIQMFRTHRRLETKRKMIKMWMAEIQKRDISFQEFTQKVGFEVFRRSSQSFQRTSYNEMDKFRTQMRTSWISEQEFCFQPHYGENGYKPITDQGYFFHFVTAHNAENLDDKKVDCMTVDFHGRPSSLTRFTQATAVNDGFIEDLCLGMWHEITVDVKALYEMLENDEEGTECREMKPGMENEFDCRMRCRLELIRRECHCTPATLGYLTEPDLAYPTCDYTQCIIDTQRRNNSDETCTNKCKRSCVQIRYNVVHSTKGKSQQPDLTRVDLSWGSFEYLVMKQDWVWSVTSFIAALGGSIGMWLGLSILSLIQGGTYLYAYLTDNVIKKNIARRISSASIFKKQSGTNLPSTKNEV